jgi:hypothetical protein
MHTVFSHIIQKRFSAHNEDVATDALAYVLESSDAAKRSMMNLLRGIIPDLPLLRFRTQQVAGAIRPDMWGFAGADPRVFVENKFWAGLTDNQPIAYLERLAALSKPTVLLVIAPAARQHTLWRELSRRLDEARISYSRLSPGPASGVAHAVATGRGPILALTSWTNVLLALDRETVDDRARGDLAQLRALCDAADDEAFAPVSREELSDQRTPAFLLQLGAVVRAAVGLAVTENVLNIRGLNPQAGWDRIGRYARLSGERGAGVWFGIHFGLWKAHGATPLWLLFSETPFGRGQEVRPLLEAWAEQENIPTAMYDGAFAIALAVRHGEEEIAVVRSLVDDLRKIARELEPLPPINIASAKQDELPAAPEG